jgi:hypothetical protein
MEGASLPAGSQSAQWCRFQGAGAAGHGANGVSRYRAVPHTLAVHHRWTGIDTTRIINLAPDSSRPYGEVEGPLASTAHISI